MENLKELTEKLIDRDISIKESEAMFKAIFCINPASMCVTDIETGELITVNLAFVELSGWTQEEIKGKSVYDLNLYVNPAARNIITKIVMERGWIKNQPVQYRQKEGGVIDCSLSTKIIGMKQKKVMISVIVDVTECKRIAELLNEIQYGRRKTDMR